MNNNFLEEMRYVSENSKYVKINYEKIESFVMEFGTPNYTHWFSNFSLKLTEKERILMVFIIESLNFCFWQKPKYKIIYHGKEVKGSEALFLKILDEIEKNDTFLDLDYLYNLSFDEFKDIFLGYESELSLIDDRYKLFNDTINTIYQKKEKFYNELFSVKSDIELLNYITNNFQYFNDVSKYKGKLVHFNKRAILLVNDLYNVSETINKNINNVNNLLGCADYGIPRTLRTYGILEYDDELSYIIDNEQELKHDSEMEVEIRANMLYALELMKKKLKEENKIINSVELDNLVWNMGRKKKNIFPYHHTVTIFY